MTELATELERAGLELTLDANIGKLTTYRVGGCARYLVEVRSGAELQRLAALMPAQRVEVCVIGKGSNLLVADSGFDGLALVLGPAFETVTIDGTAIEAGSAAALPVVARRSATVGLRGFEWAVGVPGSIGGAVRMNAGGHGSDMAAVLESAHVVSLATGAAADVSRASLALGYRTSSIGSADVVSSARIVLRPGSVVEAEKAIAEVVRWRREHQPGGQNAGSVFTNPPGDSAGRLIDAAGCKGLRIGSAHVSTKHANFFQADEGGRAADIFALMREVARRVRDNCGVSLRAETHLLGFDRAGVGAIDDETH